MVDVYAEMASLAYGVSTEEVTDEQRDKVKHAVWAYVAEMHEEIEKESEDA